MDFLQGLIPQRLQNIPLYMDFEGQKKAERIFQIIICLFAVVGFIWGYICQYFSQTVYILFAGFILACLITLPAWPMYRTKPLQWQPARQFPADGSSADVSPSSSNESSGSGQSKNKKKK